ncbi:hypothetical protein [Massilia sp. BKSP1R2A-1]|uniref:hypothetical protein n=1 Tax=Massilia sp. BKSP1R2A-1 TaxID=3422595 RepID=UPI003D329493
MRHAAFFVLLCLLASPPARSAPETTQVFLDNGELNYVGGVDADANRRLFALYDSLAAKPTVLSIRSRGGPVTAGVPLGRWVRERGLDIKVMEYCLSSCANYVFPAARRKVVSNFAVIGYHGGPGSGQVEFDADTRKMVDAMPPAQRKAFMDDLDKTIKTRVDEERAYLRWLGVREDLSTLGQQDRFQQRHLAEPNVLGWTYSLAGFAKLGVRDISVINPPWKPGSAMQKARFALIEPD